MSTSEPKPRDRAGVLWTVILAGAICGGAMGACGGDDEGTSTPRPVPAGGAAAAAAAAAGAGSGSGPKLILETHIEDRVNCPIPQKVGDRMPTPEDKCDPTVPQGACKTKGKPYCMNVPIMNGDYCFACTDKDNIRHTFRDRDFAPDQNRDPFQSFILAPVGTGSDEKPAVADKGKKEQCTEHNSYAASYSYQDLKFIGLVTQGTQRKALMSAGVRSSYILSRNDCVGKEKAIVEEIGDGYITFISQPDVAGSKPTEFTQNLHTSLALNVDAPPSEDAAVPTSTSGGANTPLPSRSTPLPQTPVPAPVPQKRLIQIPSPTPSPQVVPAAPTRITP